MKKYIAIISILFIYLSCSNSQNKIEGDELKITGIYSWINLMPGAENNFFITGKIEIDSAKNLNEFKLSEIQILQNEKLIYKINPEINSNSKNEIEFKNSGEKYNENLDAENPVKVKFFYLIEKENFTKEIDSVKVEKVY